ncbi:MAG: tRNA adenosine(34) deaminase TadA [Thermodesulfobacteriota bacterium]
MDADRLYMEKALAEARAAADRGEVPVGAVLIDGQGNILAQDGNRVIEQCDPAGHAELVVLRQAALRQANYRLPGTTLYVTLEPCAMCAGAMVHARIARLVYGAADPKSGAVHSLMHLGDDRRLNHRFASCGGVLAEECGQLLRDFFRQRREGESL